MAYSILCSFILFFRGRARWASHPTSSHMFILR
jgi:hypothetical protein